MNVKNIHIGTFIQKLYEERNISIDRVCNFMKCEEEDIFEMFQYKTLDTDRLLRWSKLLEYDFFRLYSQHLILYTSKKHFVNKSTSKNNQVPQFKKNIYTKEIIDYLLELIRTNQKTVTEIIKEYKIPKTTIYRWIQKYPTNS